MTEAQLDILMRYIEARLDAAFEKDPKQHKLAHNFAEAVKEDLYRSL